MALIFVRSSPPYPNGFDPSSIQIFWDDDPAGGHFPNDPVGRNAFVTGNFLHFFPEDESDHLFLSFDKSEKLARYTVNRIVEKYAKERGWHEKGAGVESNVTPHYFRHFFTTKMRLRGMLDIFVDYLRDDTPKTSKDIYIHLGWEEIRKTYDEHVYKFGI